MALLRASRLTAIVAVVTAIVSVIVSCAPMGLAFAAKRAQVPLVAGLALVRPAQPSPSALPADEGAPADSRGTAASTATSLDEEEDDDVHLDAGDPSEGTHDPESSRSRASPRPERASGGHWVHLDRSPRPPRA